ncbi:MAG: transglycosylase domain-containing protein [Chitinophagales bacterium]|nr:transglycosylase domain-containing protein [Chitinophagales bacterium]MDW8426962.1 transglycosylase domain-containing protein [Chitinophagales bacterium]
MPHEVTRRFIRTLWLIVFGSVAVFLLMLVLAALGAFGKMPSFEELENPHSALATEVYSADGVLLGTYFIENRSPSTLEEIPLMVRQCLIATEDIRFYRHSGIDYRGQFAALVSTLLGDVRGGSTITQQLAKNLFPRPGNNLVATILSKFKEWVIAIKLERRYTKDEILNLYLQTVQFSENSYGIKMAARTFFNRSLDSLRVEEAAVLIGMLKGSTYYNPRRNPDHALARRNVVLAQMAKYGFLPKEKLDSLTRLPIQLNFVSPDHNKGLATYFREYLRQELLKWCKDNKKPDGTPWNLYKDGLKVYTTINSRMQFYAEEAVQKHMRELQKQFFASYRNSVPWANTPGFIDEAMRKSYRWQSMKRAGIREDSILRAFHAPIPMTVFSYDGEKDTVLSPYDSIKYYKMYLHCGFLVTQPQTGHVLAWVGGINHRYFKYDHVNPGAKRQVGSTIKPILYAVAVDNGYSPCYEFPNERIVFEDYQNWSPENADGRYGGNLTLYQGLAHSVNTISAHLIRQIGPQPMIELARRMGIESHMDPYPAISLGVTDISVYEMAGVYGTFANEGTYIKPQYLLRITDNRGNVLQEFVPRQTEVLSPQVNYVMVKMLETVVNQGTGQRLRSRYGIQGAVAGKTGTTQNNTDGWFVGFTPQVVGSCWVGGEDRIIRFRSTFYGQGANMALPIFAYFLKSCYADKTLGISPHATFQVPEGPSVIETDCEKYRQYMNRPDIHYF